MREPQCAPTLISHVQQLQPYLEDAFRHATIEPASHPVRRMHVYLRQVLSMKHVAGREYSFVSATMWNKRAFIAILRAAIETVDVANVTTSDFYQILVMLCPDFPQLVLDEAANFLRPEDICDGIVDCVSLTKVFEAFWIFGDYLNCFEAVLSSPLSTRMVSTDSSPNHPNVDSIELAASIRWYYRFHRIDCLSWPAIQQALASAGPLALTYRKLCECVFRSNVTSIQIHHLRKPGLRNKTFLESFFDGSRGRCFDY